MRLFKYVGTCSNLSDVIGNVDVDDFRSLRRNISDSLAPKIDEFNRLGKDYAITFTEMSAKNGEFVILIHSGKDSADPKDIAGEFLDFVGLKAEPKNVSEITFDTFFSLANRASMNNFIDDDEFIDSCELGPMQHIKRFNGFGENLIEEGLSLKDYEERMEKMLCTGIVLPEIKRIIDSAKSKHVAGHPVQYFVESGSNDYRKGIYRNLLSALYSSNRLVSRRYIYVDIEPDDMPNDGNLDTLYKYSTGSTLVFRICGDESDEGDYSGSFRHTLVTLGEYMYKYRNRVLTIICYPRGCTSVRNSIFEGSKNLSYVELSEDYASGDVAKNYLKILAKENEVRTDKKLFSKVEDGKNYYSDELQNMFDEWYDYKIKNSVYPAYKDSKQLKVAMQGEKAKGNSYQKLNEMIGLSSAKRIINEAIDYYKAQKLFKDKGMKTSTPSMHMAFLGDPGTGKTNVARLFADILRDNKVLSSGHIVEVGRADLIGRYVGHTAPIVKHKFKEAKGGVLFIDEAYSLLDDKEGLYGDEAIATIVQEMENHRDDVVVIFAGYSDKMAKFFDRNPGLRSRIAFHVNFENYNPQELLDITKLIAKNSDCKIDPKAEEKLLSYYAGAINSKDFGNGRAARNIVEKARLAQSSRLVKMDYDKVTKEDCCTLKAEDFIFPQTEAKTQKAIGFCA